MTQHKINENENVTIIRKAKKSRYTMINNSLLQDRRLSWKAKGILSYLLHLPDDWKIYLKELQTHATDGKESLASGMKELKTFGYVTHESIREKGRIVTHVWIIHEEPEFTETKSSHIECEPEAGKPESGFSGTGKPATTNTKDSELHSESKQKTKDILHAPIVALSADADDLLSFFIQKLRQMKPDMKLPSLILHNEGYNKWLKEIDRMIRVDKRDPKKIKAMIEWIHRDSFWSANILSPKKLRDQYDQIELQAKRKSESSVMQKNKEYAMRMKQKYPESYKNLLFNTKYACHQGTGKELPLDFVHESFKKEFIKMFGGNFNDLSESDKN